MTTSIPALLEPIQARLNAATPGPWDVEDDDGFGHKVYKPGGWGTMYICEGLQQGHDDGLNDAVFIAHAPTDTARLLAAVKAVAEVHPREVIAVHEGYGQEAVCPECQLHYPCLTVSAVEAALRSEA